MSSFLRELQNSPSSPQSVRASIFAARAERASIIAAMLSALAKSILPFSTALLLNSPGFAALAPRAKSSSIIAELAASPP